MEKILVKPYDVVGNTDLPEVTLDHEPTDGDPVEIEGNLYFVCELNYEMPEDKPVVGVIPLVVRNPAKIKDINKYIECLSIAHRKVKFVNEQGTCDLESCNEMVIS